MSDNTLVSDIVAAAIRFAVEDDYDDTTTSPEYIHDSWDDARLALREAVTALAAANDVRLRDFAPHTGQQVPRSGTWQPDNGAKQIAISKGETFPPAGGVSATYTLVDPTD